MFSMMGAFICGVGYYTVLWGQIKEEELQKLESGKISSSHDEKAPLLQDQDSQVWRVEIVHDFEILFWAG